VDFCSARRLHLISDEIYALSSRAGLGAHSRSIGAAANPAGTAAAAAGTAGTTTTAAAAADSAAATVAAAVAGETPFTSLATVLRGRLGARCHVMWGLSKDLGASGARVGVLLSGNAALLDAMSTLGMFAGALELAGRATHSA
jgi:aspartate/methionine/tyrosine aminotransferase